ncbi:unnamed protein product [Rotaria sordida]|uniref:G-protein coupled receptors family 1 profile domain-containing protein n=1 Tax=Rotaria sordida TaxID=392033 RepID=A0A814XZD2_9BILA|nr:unnamed protein product [Rotaria sordida]
MSAATLLYSIQQNILRIGGPILITMGSISCILNLMVFTKDTLRKNPCTICFVAINIINFSYFYLGLLFTTLAVGYNIDPSASNIAFCRFRYYVGLVLACWESSYIILASIDHTLVTSPNAGTRKLSTRRLIATSMISIGLFWILFHIHALIFMGILQFDPNYFVCFYQPGIYTIIMTYYILVINGILPPLLMAIFGFWTVKNIRQIRRSTHHSGSINIAHTGVTMVGRPHTLQSKDKQLMRILFVDIIIFVICKFPVTIF